MSPLTFAATAVGSTASATQTVILGNDGNQPVAYTGNGLSGLNDIDDFPAKTAASPACSFYSPLNPGFTCNLTYSFSPTSSGVRTEQIAVTSNSLTAPIIFLTGDSTTSVTGTVALTVALSTPATGSPAPFQSIAITATAKPSATAAPTGAITFAVDGVTTSSIELASGTAVLTLPAGLAVGAHTITATYAGDKNYQPVSVAVSLAVTVVLSASTVSLTASGTDIAVGQALTLSGLVPTLTGLRTPTGTLTFTDATTSTTLGTATLNSGGDGSISVSTLALGSHSLCVAYGGDNVYTSSTSSCVSVSVGNYAATTTALSVTPTQPTGGYSYGTPIKATATVTNASGTPSGSVEFTLDGYPQTATLSAGAVAVTLSSINAGTHVLVACYNGSTTYASSCANPVSFTVVKAVTVTTLAVSAQTLYATQIETLTANVSSTTSSPGGSVAFYNGASLIGTGTISNGVATLITTQLPVGANSITASYAGDSNDVVSASTATVVTVQIIPTVLTFSVSPGTILSGGTTTLTATLTSVVPSVVFTGTVTFMSGTATVGTGNVSATGVATITTAALTAPSTCYTASFPGTPNFTASSVTTPTCVYVTNDSGSGVIATATLGTGLSSAAGVALDISGNLYISDSTKGIVALVAGGAGAQTNVISGLTSPAGVATDGTGDLFIASGTAVTEVPFVNGALSASSAKQIGTGLGTLTGVAVDKSGNVYVSDVTNKQVVKISSTGTQTVLSSGLVYPTQVAVDSLGDVYFADANRVVYLPASGTATTVGTGLSSPTGVAVDIYNNVYISDTGNNRVVTIPFTPAALPRPAARRR